MAEVVCFMNAVQAHSGTVLPSAWTRSRTFKTHLYRLVWNIYALSDSVKICRALRSLFWLFRSGHKFIRNVHRFFRAIIQFIFTYLEMMVVVRISYPTEMCKCVDWMTQIKLFSGMLWSLPNVKLGIMLKCLRREMFAAWQHRCKSIYVRTEQHSVKVNWTEWTKRGCQQMREIIWSHLPDTILGMESHPNVIKSK